MDKKNEPLIAEIKNNTALEDRRKSNEYLPSEICVANKQFKTAELIEAAFNQAVISKIAESDGIKNDLIYNAEKVIKNQTDAINSDAEAMSKKAHFNNKKGACECFGFNEDTTEKWAVNTMNAWHNVMTAVWMFIGFFTFAPITFISKKITVIFKKSWVAVLLAILIYVTIVFVPVIAVLI